MKNNKIIIFADDVMGTLVRTEFLILKKAIEQKHMHLSKYCIDKEYERIGPWQEK